MIKLIYRAIFLITIGSFFQTEIRAQEIIDHWETVVFANDIWRYRLGFTPHPTNWRQPSFNDNSWSAGTGGIGYGDGDDNTIISITAAYAMRHSFEIIDINKVKGLILHADYDDGFAAYLNGEEIARSNVSGNPPAYNATADGNHEAVMYDGGTPEMFTIQNFEDLLVQGINVLAISVHNVGTSSSDMSGNFFLSLGINDQSMDYEPTPDWFEAPFVFSSSDLPLVVINTNGQTINGNNQLFADMGIINNGPIERNYLNDPFNEYDGHIGIKIRGASSSWFPKKNYSMETQNDDGSNNNVSLLGMPEENDWVLHGPYADKSLIRNMVTFEFAQKMSPWAPRTRPVELVINGEYMGFYVLMERVKRDDNRVDIAKLNPEDIEGDELTGGYLLQIDRDNPDLPDGWYGSVSDQFYAFNDPDWDEINTPQQAYIVNWINGFEEAMDANDYFDTYKDWMDEDSFVDYLLATELTKHIDAYRLSFFMYKRKDSNGGKLHAGPQWDINLGYGNYDFGCDNSWNGWSWDWFQVCAPVVYWVNRLAQIPSFQNKLDCRWTELREGPLQTDTLLNYIDELALTIDEAQDRNFQRWNILGEYVWPNDFIGDTHAQEITYLKNWVTNRLIWMDNNMPGNCALVDTKEQSLDQNILKVYPNPFSNNINFELKGETISNVNILIYDVFGKLVKQFELGTQEILQLQLEALPKGLYYYQATKENQTLQQGKITKS